MPADYVNKLARMFQDIKVSEDLNQSFKEMHKHNKLALPGEKKMLSDKVYIFEELEPVNIWHIYCINLLTVICWQNWTKL